MVGWARFNVPVDTV